MNLRSFEGENVRLMTIDGEIFEGKATDYIFPEDNEPEGIESLIVKPFSGFRMAGHYVEFPREEIKSIELIK
ncbi:MAG: hypothetical protein LUD77_08810 [Clostridiales bacterium]|nr:hypothetical protein [Clostridiales bacterium]